MFDSCTILVRYLFDKHRTSIGQLTGKYWTNSLPEWEVILREAWERPEEDKRKTRGKLEGSELRLCHIVS